MKFLEVDFDNWNIENILHSEKEFLEFHCGTFVPPLMVKYLYFNTRKQRKSLKKPKVGTKCSLILLQTMDNISLSL
jgi:hypothetical protein